MSQSKGRLRGWQGWRRTRRSSRSERRLAAAGGRRRRRAGAGTAAGRAVAQGGRVGTSAGALTCEKLRREAKRHLFGQGGKGARKAGGKGLRGLCEAEGVACGGRPLTDDTKNLDRPRPGAERVVRKRSGSGGSRRPTSKSRNHLEIAPPSKMFSRPKPDDLPTNSDAQPWFEGAGSRPRASRAHAWQAISGRLGVPRWRVLGWGARSGPAHRASRRPRIEPCPSRPRRGRC